MLFQHYKKISLISTGLRWCSDVPIVGLKEPKGQKDSPDGPSQTKSSLELTMDSLIDEHLFYLPLPRYARTFEGPEPDASTIIKASSLSLFASEGAQDLSVIRDLYAEWYPCIDFLRDPNADIEAQACVLCLLVLDAKSLRNLSTFTGKFKHLAFEELKRETGHFTTFKDMLIKVNEHATLLNSAKSKTSEVAKPMDRKEKSDVQVSQSIQPDERPEAFC